MTHSLLKLAGCLALGWSGAACGSTSPAASLGAGGSRGNVTGGTGGSMAETGGAGGQSSAGSSGTNREGGGGSSTTDGGTDAGGPVPPFPPLIDGCDIPAAHAHADDALAAAITNFWSGADQYVRAASPANGKLAGYGTYAQAFDALLDGVERTGGQHYRGLVRAYYEGSVARGWLVDYSDQEAWMALALIRAFDLTGEPFYLDTAETIYQDIMTQWDTTCCGPHLGGIWWDKKKTEKATASNAGAALAGVRLAKRSGKSQYLDFAKQAYAFWMTDMVDATTFAIYDHLSPDGQRLPGTFTHNHGLMIGAALELNAATGEAHYLTEAHGFGHYLITTATQASSAGPVLYDGATCSGDCATYKGIGYRYLAELFRSDPTHADYRNVLVSGANALFTLGRNATNNFFSSNWAGPAPMTGTIEAQSSATMALNLYAMLCGPDPAAAPSQGVYQAEEGWLDHLDAEAHAGRNFIGFGYVSGFTADKQGFTLDVEVEKAGQYALDWRYTAGEGTCKRSVLVNGQALSEQQVFPGTPNWTNWPNARTITDLPAGKSTIGLRFDAAKGSVTSLDIDQLTITPM